MKVSNRSVFFPRRGYRPRPPGGKNRPGYPVTAFPRHGCRGWEANRRFAETAAGSGTPQAPRPERARSGPDRREGPASVASGPRAGRSTRRRGRGRTPSLEPVAFPRSPRRGAEGVGRERSERSAAEKAKACTPPPIRDQARAGVAGPTAEWEGGAVADQVVGPAVERARPGRASRPRGPNHRGDHSVQGDAPNRNVEGPRTASRPGRATVGCVELKDGRRLKIASRR